jgi:hypothetical protein
MSLYDSPFLRRAVSGMCQPRQNCPGGGRFVRSKRYASRNLFTSKALQVQKIAKNHLSVSQFPKTGANHQSPTTNHPGRKPDPWGGCGSVRSKSLVSHNLFNINTLQTQKSAKSVHPVSQFPKAAAPSNAKLVAPHALE